MILQTRPKPPSQITLGEVVSFANREQFSPVDDKCFIQATKDHISSNPAEAAQLIGKLFRIAQRQKEDIADRRGRDILQTILPPLLWGATTVPMAYFLVLACKYALESVQDRSE
jgi:hypothetical protein